MLASLMAAGTGINLTSANHCFICDRELSSGLELGLVWVGVGIEDGGRVEWGRVLVG